MNSFDFKGDLVQEQMAQEVAFDGYGLIPYETETFSLIEFLIENPWLGVVFIVGAISCAVVAVRVLTKNPWVNEMLRMWRTR